MEKGLFLSSEVARSGSLLTKFVSTALFPLHERIGGTALSRSFSRSSRSRSGPIRPILKNFAIRASKISWLELRVMLFSIRICLEISALIHAAIQRPTDLAMLPLLDKGDCAGQCGEVEITQCKWVGALQHWGSSGEPLVFLWEARRSHDVAAKWRATRWWGWISETQGRCLGFSQSVVRPGQSQKSQGRVIA